MISIDNVGKLEWVCSGVLPYSSSMRITSAGIRVPMTTGLPPTLSGSVSTRLQPLQLIISRRHQGTAFYCLTARWVALGLQVLKCVGQYATAELAFLALPAK